MRTYKDIDIKYYDKNGDVHVRCSVPVTENALVHFELMQSHYCKLPFVLEKAVYFKPGDFIETDYGRFELTDNVKPKDEGTIGYSYELQMDAYYRKWKNKRLKYMPNSGSPEGTFSLTSNILTHANVIKDNLDFLAKASKSYLYDPNYDGEGTDFTFVVDASVDKTKAKAITYSNSSILDAIVNIAQTFECEWWVEGNIVHFGTCENTNEVVDFKDGENIVSMSSSQSQASYANRVYAFGAARNLPSGYKQNSSADVTKNGVVEKRLMLPTLEECSSENKKLLEDNGFELKDGYIQVNGLTEDQYVEGVTTNDDIYPRNLIKTSNVTYYERDVEDESTPEEGDYIKRTFYRVKGLTIVDKDGNKTGDMAFRSSYILSGKNLHIIFQSGSLNGMDFECQFNPDGESEILRDSNGSPILKDGKEQINPAAQVFEIVANEDYGRFLPDETLHPKDGDTFVLYNWDSTKLGDTLVTSSANELLTDAIKNLKKSMIDPTTYTCTAASDYSYNDGKGQFHLEGDRVNLYNKGYDEAFRASRIIGYELHLDVPFDSVKYTVGEKPAYSRLNAMSSQIEELVFNGQSYMNQGGGGSSIYIIKSYDTTRPSEYNVYSAKAIDSQRLSKVKDDTVAGSITFQAIQHFLKGMTVGANGDWTLDELGNTHLNTDYLQVRMKAIFETLEILHTDTLGGELFITPVGSNRILKVENVSVTYNDIKQTAFRCYFLGEQDGSKIENKWRVGDQARSKSFNLTAGKYHNVGNHYYWRLVIGVSSEAVEIDGKKYHYVDLSDIDKDAASDEPMVDDILNQCGNRTDNTRQSCLLFSAVDTYSPCITLYHGVDGYTFNNKEYVDYGVNHSTNKAFFHVYGDMYFGDRPTSANNYEGDSYVKYDSDKKKVTIKGDLDIKSTYDGKTLDKYITEKTLDEEAVETIIKDSQTISDLQNQIDGAIETWFYDGVPTLSNAPASGWDTDKKETHLGDLYYDNKTGKAYRFAKDGSTYKWIIITDTELTKALKDSSQALKDAAAADKKAGNAQSSANGAQAIANSKRRIFGSQPVPPYDVNDMWVNATYPSDGSTYKNEILKCATAKAEGEKFDIADWKLASKYTDDTKAEEAKKAAEKAQEDIKTTQTNLTTLGTTVSHNKKAFDDFTSDGYLDSSEIAAIAQDSKRLEDDYNAAVESYNNVIDSKFLLDEDGKDTTYKTDLTTAKGTLDTAKTELLTYLSDIVTRYNATDANGKATIKSAVAQKYTNFTNAYKAFYDKLGVANSYITSNLFDGLNAELITNMAGLDYLKAALINGKNTEIKGGLILSTLIALRNEKGDVTAGINGADTKEDGIALWLGGKAIDKQASTTTEEEQKTAAKSLLRFDGTGYFANGNLWWDADGTLHADPTSFIINENNVGVQLALFAPVWKSGTTDTTKLANVLSIDPQKPFTHLDVSGNVTTEGSLKIGGIYLSYDSANNALRLSKDAAGKEAANFYALGGITAYGKGAGTTGGGGSNATVKLYSEAIQLTTDSRDLVASAYSVAALNNSISGVASRVSSLESGSATSIEITGSGNAITSVSKSGTKLSFAKGATFLTSHQSLADYLKKSDADNTYLKLGGGTMSGILYTANEIYLDEYDSGAINMCNSNIVGINSLYTDDLSDNQSEGIHFYRDATHVDSLRMQNGKLLFTPNRPLGGTNTEYEVIHSGTIGSQSVSNADKLDGYHASDIHTAGWVSLYRTGGNENTIKWTRIGRFITTTNDDWRNDAMIEFFSNGDQNYDYFGHGTLMCSSYGKTGNRCIMLSSVSDGKTHFYATIDDEGYIWLGHNNIWSGNSAYRLLFHGAYVEFYSNNKIYQTTNPTTTPANSFVTDNGTKYMKQNVYTNVILNNMNVSNSDMLDGKHFSDIQVGAYNYFRRGSYWCYPNDASVTKDNSINGYVINNQIELPNRISNINTNGIISNWTVSFYIKASKVCNVVVDMCDILANTLYNEDSNIKVTTEYVYHKFTFINVAQYIGINSYNGFLDVACKDENGIVIYVKDIKIERGTIATPWCLNPADESVASATKLVTARTLWGQSFDGTNNVSGNMYNIGTNARLNIISVSSDMDFLHLYVSSGTTTHTNEQPLVMQYGYGNVGIGLIAPTEKLEVQGNIKSNGSSIKLSPVGLDVTAKNVVQIIKLGTSGITGAMNWAIRGVYQYTTGVNENAEGGDLDIIKSIDGVIAIATKTDGMALGDVGIGTTSPKNRLHVNGHIRGNGFHLEGATDSHVLLGDGGYKLESNLSVNKSVYSDNILVSQDESNTMSLILGFGNGSYLSPRKTQHLSYEGSTQTLNVENIHGNAALFDGGLITRWGDDNVLRIYGTDASDENEKIFIQSQIDNRTGDYDVAGYGGYGRHRIVLQPRGGRVGICDENPAYTLEVGGAEGTCRVSKKLMVGTTSNSCCLNVGGDSVFYDTVSFNSIVQFKGIGFCGFMPGTADTSGSYTDANVIFKAWWSLAFSGYNDVISIVFDTRSGNIKAKGNIQADTNLIAGGNLTINSIVLEKDTNNSALKVNSNLYATGGVTAYQTSDKRLKHDLHKEDFLGIVRKMGGTFAFIYNEDNEHSIGWVAQSVLENPFMSDLVKMDEKGYYKINYWSPKLIATAFGAIEQVDDEVTRLKKKVKTLEKRVKELENK